MIIVTTDQVAGYQIEEVLGEVTGMLAQSAVQFGTSGWQALGGGEMTEYTQLLHTCRNQAMNRLWTEAESRGANAIVGMRYDVSTIASSLLEVCAYGTAVVLRPLADGEPGATIQSAKQAAETGGGPASPQQPSPARRGNPAWMPAARPPAPPNQPPPGFQSPGHQQQQQPPPPPPPPQAPGSGFR